jgi:hypothetical protein
MKRAGKLLLILFGIIGVSVVVIPLIFKDQIINKFKEEVNKQLLADVDFGRFKLSLIRDFPNLHFGVEDFVVTGRDTFAGIELARIGDFRISLDLLSVFKGEQFKIRKIGVENANIHLIVLDSATANYLILPTSEEEEIPTEDTISTSFNLALKKYYFKNINLIYEDRLAGIYTEINHLNHEGKGDFTEEKVNLSTSTKIDELTFKSDGIALLSRVAVASDFDIKINQNTMEFSFGDNFLELNDLRLNFKGVIRMPDENIETDVEFDTPNSSFKSIISLIPAIYYQDFAKLTARGIASLTGKVQGTFNSEQEIYPKFNILLTIRDGYFKYPDLPAAVEAVNTDFRITNPGGSLDNTLLTIPGFSMKLADNPIEAALMVSTPISDPFIDFMFNGKLDLGTISKLVPIDKSVELKGLMDAGLTLKAKLSDIESERYDKVVAEGRVLVRDFLFKDPAALALPVSISKAKVVAQPEHFRLEELSMAIGQSDIRATGRFDNLLSYVFKDTSLFGRFDVSSKIFDLNELANISTDTAAASATEGTEEDYIRLPDQIDFTLTASADRVLFSDFDIGNFTGTVTLSDQKAIMNNVQMELVGGRVLLSGFYDSKLPVPVFDFSLNLENFGIQQSFQTFSTAKALAPIAKNSEGQFNVAFKISGPLNRDMTPDLTKITSAGSIKTNNILLRSDALAQIGSFLRNQDYSTLTLRDANISFKIENGRVFVTPFQVKTGQVTGTISGSNGLDQTLDYDMELKIPGSAVRADQLLASLGGKAPQTIDLRVKITGTYTNPKVSTTLGNVVGDLVTQVKEKIKETAEQKVEDLKQQINAEAERIMADARAQAERIMNQAQQQADKVRADARAAADKVRAEGRAQAQRLRDEAKGNIVKERAANEAARRLEQEAENNARKIELEADRRAEQLVQQAREQSNQILTEAENKARVK